MAPSPQERRRSFLLSVALVAVNLVLLNWVALGHFTRLDLTKDKLYTLHPATVELLSELNDLVTLRIYMSERVFQDHEAYAFIPREVRDWVTEFVSAADGKIVVEYKDPSGDERLRAEATASRIAEIRIEGQRDESVETLFVFCGMVVSYGGKDQLIPYARADRIELDLALAITRLTQREVITVGFNEVYRLPDGATAADAMRYGAPVDRFRTDTTYGLLKANLEQLYDIEVVPTDTEVPPHVDVLVVCNTDGLNDVHKFHIDQYLMKGGRVVFLAEGVDIDQRTRTPFARKGDLDEFFGHYGFTVEKKLVLDTQCFRNEPRVPNLLPENFDTKETLLNGVPAFILPYASPLWLNPPPDVEATALARSSNLAWEELGAFTPVDDQVKAPTRVDEYGQFDLVAMLKGEFTSYFSRRKLPDGVTGSRGPTADEFEEMRRQQGGSEEDEKTPEDPPPGDSPPADPAGGDGGPGGQDDGGVESDEDVDEDEDAVVATPGMAQGLFVRDKAPADTTIVVVGNALFLHNTFLGNAGNYNFFATVIDRLTTGGRLSAVRHRSSDAPAIRADLTSAEKSAIKYAGMIGMPAIVALVGVAVSLIRRQRRRVALEATS